MCSFENKAKKLLLIKRVISTLLENITTFQRRKQQFNQKIANERNHFCICMIEAQNIHKYSTWVPWTNLNERNKSYFKLT